MEAIKIMLIRHAEKPDDRAGIKGMTLEGDSDPEELTVRGWQRAGSLIGLFMAQTANKAGHQLALPTAIFASGVGHHSRSLRPQHTVAPLAEKIGVRVNTNYTKGEEQALVTDALEHGGVILIAWEHQLIPKIAILIVGNETTCPQSWPDERFDLLWVLERRDLSSGWSFQQIPQQLLSGDVVEPTG